MAIPAPLVSNIGSGSGLDAGGVPGSARQHARDCAIHARGNVVRATIATTSTTVMNAIVKLCLAAACRFFDGGFESQLNWRWHERYHANFKSNPTHVYLNP